MDDRPTASASHQFRRAEHPAARTPTARLYRRRIVSRSSRPRVPYLCCLIVMALQELLAQTSSQWYRVPAPGDVQRVYITADSTLFACTNTGLYREDLHTGGWKFYTSADGFIGNDVYDAAPGSAGKIYFAASPLAVFKGNSFSSFSIDSIPNAADVVVDRNGSLWCAAWQGVYRYGPTGWEKFTYQIGEGNHIVIALDSAGRIWCGGGDSNINYYDSLGWHLEQYFQEGITGTAMALTTAEDGALWVGTSDGYLGRRSNGLWSLGRSTVFPSPVTGIAVRNDTVWVAANSLFRGIGSSWTQFKASDGLADDNPTSATFDRWGQLWIGHPGGRVSILKDGSWSAKPLGTDLPDFHASSIAANGNGFIAVGTKLRGVALFDRVTWKTIQPGLPSDTVSVVRFDNAGNLWVGTPKGVGMYNGYGWKNYTTADGLPSNDIACLAVSNANSVWCSTRTSLARFNGNTWNSYSIPSGIGISNIGDLAIDSAGAVWAATDSGIIRFDGKTFTHYYPLSKHTGITSIAIDRHGIKWCGSDSAGAWQFNDTVWVALDWRSAGSLPITSVRVGLDGSVWFGAAYEQGVYRFDGTTWSNFSEIDGLADGDVHDVAFDKEGNAWMASEFGVSAYNKDGVVLSVQSSRTAQSPLNFELKQNYPNPFNPTTRIDYATTSRSYVQLAVYNILGQLIKKLVQQWREPGNYSIDFDGAGLPSGIYICRMTASGGAGVFIRAGKMVLLR